MMIKTNKGKARLFLAYFSFFMFMMTVVYALLLFIDDGGNSQFYDQNCGEGRLKMPTSCDEICPSSFNCTEWGVCATYFSELCLHTGIKTLDDSGCKKDSFPDEAARLMFAKDTMERYRYIRMYYDGVGCDLRNDLKTSIECAFYLIYLNLAFLILALTKQLFRRQTKMIIRIDRLPEPGKSNVVIIKENETKKIILKKADKKSEKIEKV